MASLKKAVVKLRNLPRGRAKCYPTPLCFQADSFIPKRHIRVWPRGFLRFNS